MSPVARPASGGQWKYWLLGFTAVAVAAAYPLYMRLGPADLNFDGVVSDSEMIRALDHNKAVIMEPGTWTFEALSFKGGDVFRPWIDVVQGEREMSATDIVSVFRRIEIDGRPMLPFEPGKCIIESTNFSLSTNQANGQGGLQALVRCDLENPNNLDTGSPGILSISYTRSCVRGFVQLYISNEKKFGTNNGFQIGFRAKKDDSCDTIPFYIAQVPGDEITGTGPFGNSAASDLGAAAAASDAAAAATAAASEAAAAAAADAAGYSTFHIVADANRRSRATAASSFSGKISRGTVLQGTMVIGEDGESNWLRLADGSGFVSSVNISDTPPPHLATTLGDRRFRPASDLQLYAMPSEQSAVVDTVPAGTLLGT